MLRTSALAAILATASAQRVPVRQEIMREIVSGIMYSAADTEYMPDILICIQQYEQFDDSCKSAVDDLAQQDIEHMTQGIKKVGAIIKGIKDDLIDCTEVHGIDWNQLESIALIFENPNSVTFDAGRDLIINGVDIYQEISTAISDYQAGNWYQLGENLGEAGKKVIIGEKLIQEQNNTKEKETLFLY